jgi:hypothetical protein
MALNYFVSDYSDLSKGIDQRSTPNLIKDGYSQDLANVTTNSEGYLEKRKGYQGYYGYVPLRVQSVEYTSDLTNNVIFYLDGSINLTQVDPTPIIVSGKLSNTSMDGDFVDSVIQSAYYTTYTVDQPITIEDAPLGTTLTKTAAETGIASNAVAVGLVESTNPGVDLSNSQFILDNIDVDSATYQVDIDYTNGTGGDLKGFLYFKDKSAVVGSIYHHTITGVSTVSIPGTTHNLTNFNIIAQVEELSGGKYTIIIPDSVTIDQTTGDVEIVLSSVVASGRVILTAVDVANKVNGSIVAGTTETITIPNPETGFAYVACYFEPTPGADFEQVLPDNIVYDATQDELQITFTNGTTNTVNFEIYYEFANLTVNAVKVTGTVTVTGTDSEPQLTIWGISHDGIYNPTAVDGGTVNHIDSYKSVAESRVLCGLGGNIFKALEADSIGATVAPMRFPNIRNRLNVDLLVAPLFQLTGSAVARTRGTIEADNVLDNQVDVLSASYNSGTGYVDYVLQVTNKAILDSVGAPALISDVISVASNLEDYLTVSSMGHSRLNGTFKIEALDNTSANTITISVANSDVISSDYDELNAGGKAGIFTDRLTFLTTSTFASDDLVSADVLTSSDNLVISSTLTSSIVVKNVSREISFPNGLRVFGTRTSSVVNLRDVGNSPNTSYIVVGDMLVISGYDRRIRVIDINSTDNSITIDEELELSDTGDNSVMIRPIGRWYPVEIPSSSGDLTPQTRVMHFDSNPYSSQPALRSTIIADNMYFTNHDDEVLKFDGSNIYRAGLYKWSPQLFATLDTSVASFNVDETDVSATTPAERSITVDSTVGFTPGETVYFTQDGDYYTIDRIDDTAKKLFVLEEPPVFAGTPTLNKPLEYRYYFRLNMIDANNNIIASASTGSQDFRVRVNQDSRIVLKLVNLPVMDIYDYDKIEVQVYRTLSNTQAPFYLIGTVPVDFNASEGYLIFRDGIVDEALDDGDLDPAMSALLGQELGLNWNQPLRAKYITSTANKLALANLKDFQQLDIIVRKNSGEAALSTSALTQANETRWLFRKSNLDSSTTTNMVDRVAYEFIDNTNTVTIAPATDIDNSNTDYFEVTSTTHGLSVGDWVYFYHSSEGANNSLTFAGWYQVRSVPTSDTFQIYANTGTAVATADDVDQYITATLPADVPVLLGTDGNYNTVRSNISSGNYGTIAAIRLANAINSSMRLADTGITSQEDFVPWMTANSGSEYGSGRLVVSQPTVFTTTLELKLDSSHGTSYKVFVNNIVRSSSAEVGADTNLYPSRVIVSYANYPELFDMFNNDGTSVVDINSADGQEITGIIPFFSESAFSGSTKEGVLVIFKTQSIYLADVNQSPVAVQKIDSQGLGCIYPFSIAPTRNGIMFANRSGIYRLNYDLTISYAGKMIEGLWTNSVNKDASLVPTAHHYALERRYELSVPVNGDSKNSQVYVYDHTREGVDQEYGAWSRFTNFPATGWANLDDDAFFATTDGQVYQIRRLNDSSDFRDDGDAVDEMIVVTKPFTFGSVGIRHKLRSVTSHFKVTDSMLNTAVQVAIDLSSHFLDTDDFDITDMNSSSPYLDRQIVPMQLNIPVQKFMYLQFRFVNSGKDEAFVLSSISFVAAPLSGQGIQQSGRVTA